MLVNGVLEELTLILRFQYVINNDFRVMKFYEG